MSKKANHRPGHTQKKPDNISTKKSAIRMRFGKVSSFMYEKEFMRIKKCLWTGPAWRIFLILLYKIPIHSKLILKIKSIHASENVFAVAPLKEGRLPPSPS